MSAKEELVKKGLDAIEKLEAAKEYLVSAKKWGVFGALFENNFLGSFFKYDKIEKARSCLDAARVSLSEFTIVADELDVDISEFMMLFDVLSKSLFFDIHAHIKINKAIEKIDDAVNKISMIVSENEKT